MSRRIATLLAALVAATGLTILAGPGAVAADEDADPLLVEIDSITPGVVPSDGPIRVAGSVTNLDDDTWTTVNLYSVVSSTPMTTSAELEAAAQLPADASVGERVFVNGAASDTIPELAPGARQAFSFEVPREALEVSEQGVYWFGVQALGQGPEGRDLSADGRARTFLPLVTDRTDPLGLSVVVPLRRRIAYAEDGRVDDLEAWTRALSDGGALRSLVDVGVSASTRAVTYLLDPALLVAVDQLADGNPARSLRPTVPLEAGQGTDDPQGPGDDGGSSPSPQDAGGTPDGASPSDAATPDEAEPTIGPLDAETADAQAAAQSWLAQLARALPGHEVLALPYGDLDVAAAAAHAPRDYADARGRATLVMADLGIDSTPAVGSPGGYLDAAGLALSDPSDLVLVADRMFGERSAAADPEADPGSSGPTRTVVTDAGHRIVVTSTTSTDGPGPGEPRSALAVRQRTLADAAVRAVGTGQPLVVVLPSTWTPSSASGFFSGLDAPWLDLQPVSAIAAEPATPVTWGDLSYPRSQDRIELGAPEFAAAADLTQAGAGLQSLLTRNDQVGRAVADQALTTLSYTSRSRTRRSRESAAASTDWIQERLGRVQVEAPTAFTMTGTTGNFSAAVVNGLNQPVTVALAAESDAGIEITRPTTVDIPASGRTRMLLQASAPDGGIHRVTLRLTDADGAVIGDADQLTIRSLRVSMVIWVIMAGAGLLLLGAIVVRLARRVRAARRPDPVGA